MSSLALAKSPTSLPRRCYLTAARSAGAGGPNGTWTSGASAPASDYLPRPRSSWSVPGTPGKPNGTGAVRSTTGLATPITRSGHADQPPWAVLHRLCGNGAAGVHETGRRSRCSRVGSYRQPDPGSLQPSRRGPPTRQSPPATTLPVHLVEDPG